MQRKKSRWRLLGRIAVTIVAIFVLGILRIIYVVEMDRRAQRQIAQEEALQAKRTANLFAKIMEDAYKAEMAKPLPISRIPINSNFYLLCRLNQ